MPPCLPDHSSNQLLEVHLVPFAVVCCEERRQLCHPLLHFLQPLSELRLILDGLLAERAFARRGRQLQLRLTERLARRYSLQLPHKRPVAAGPADDAAAAAAGGALMGEEGRRGDRMSWERDEGKRKGAWAVRKGERNTQTRERPWRPRVVHACACLRKQLTLARTLA